MADRALAPLPEEQVFCRRQTASSTAVLWLAGGVIALAIAAIGFVLALVLRVDPLALHSMTTLPALGGIGALVGGWMTARTPDEVGVGPGGVRIASHRGSSTYGWDQIGWSSIQTSGFFARRYLRLYDCRGRTLARISSAIEDFDALADMVAQRIAAKPDQTAQQIQAARGRRTALLAGGLGLTLLVISCFLAWNTRSEIQAAERLKQEGIRGDAQIEQRFLAPDGVTPRLVYRITTPDGRTASRNAEMKRPVWDLLAQVKTVPVVYVPDDPAVSRLQFGEEEERDPFKQPAIGYSLPAVAAVFALFLLAGAPFLWRGWDIKMDSKSGRISIRRPPARA